MNLIKQIKAALELQALEEKAANGDVFADMEVNARKMSITEAKCGSKAPMKKSEDEEEKLPFAPSGEWHDMPGEVEWYDSNGRPDPNGSFDANGHYYAERDADKKDAKRSAAKDKVKESYTREGDRIIVDDLSDKQLGVLVRRMHRLMKDSDIDAGDLHSAAMAAMDEDGAFDDLPRAAENRLINTLVDVYKKHKKMGKLTEGTREQKDVTFTKQQMKDMKKLIAQYKEAKVKSVGEFAGDDLEMLEYSPDDIDKMVPYIVTAVKAK